MWERDDLIQAIGVAVQTVMVIATFMAIVIAVDIHSADQQAIESQKMDELKASAIALQLDVFRLKTGVDPLDEVKIRYNNTNCENEAINKAYPPPIGAIYLPNGVFFAFQRDIAKFNPTVASEVYSFYYNLQEAEFFRNKWAANPNDMTSDVALINIRLSNKNRCLAAMQSDRILDLLNQTIESL